MNDREEFQISLAAARVNADLTQDEAAKKLGVTRQTIMNWEKGKIVPRIPELDMLAKVYGIKKDYIFLPYNSTKSKLPC